MSSCDNVILVEEDALANVEAGVNRVVNVAVRNQSQSQAMRKQLDQRIDLSGLWSQSDALAQNNLLLYHDSDLCLL